MLHATEKFIAVLCITHSTRRDDCHSIDLRDIDGLPPFLEALDHPIHRRNAQPLGLIDALSQPEDSSLRSYFYQTPARSLSDIAVRDEAKEVRPDARPQARKNRKCIRCLVSNVYRNEVINDLHRFLPM